MLLRYTKHKLVEVVATQHLLESISGDGAPDKLCTTVAKTMLGEDASMKAGGIG